MSREELIAAVEGEIARLEQAVALLRESTTERFTPLAARTAPGGKKPRVLTADARGRIAQAQKRRWARERATKLVP